MLLKPGRFPDVLSMTERGVENASPIVRSPPGNWEKSKLSCVRMPVKRQQHIDPQSVEALKKIDFVEDLERLSKSPGGGVFVIMNGTKNADLIAMRFKLSA